VTEIPFQDSRVLAGRSGPEVLIVTGAALTASHLRGLAHETWVAYSFYEHHFSIVASQCEIALLASSLDMSIRAVEIARRAPLATASFSSIK
jgi:hypothetical protein